MWVVLALGVALFLLLRQFLKKPSDLPPGHWGLPLLGWFPLSFKKSFEDHLMDLRKQHGDIYMWRIGTRIMVFINDYKLLREAFASSDIVDRPDWRVLTFNEMPAKGVLSSNGLTWHNNRRFALRQLRDLGMGKSKLVGAVQTQAEMLIEEFKKQAGKAATLPHAINVAVVNIIWQMVASIQFKVTDKKFKEFQDLLDELFEAVDRLTVLDMLPWIDRALPGSLINWISGKNIIDKVIDRFSIYIQEIVQEHKATLDRDNPRDLIDAYLIEMEKDNPDSTCSDKDLFFLILDLFNAGSQTTNDMITWTIFYLANHTEAQEKMQREIDEVLPRGTLPTLEDKARLAYTEAVVHEVLRMASLISLGAPHTTTRDIKLAGYTIPKGAIVNGINFMIHSDARYWDNPEKFRPERWLNEEGKLVSKKEGFIPFGSGKRQCVGEGLARMELFIFVTAIFQNFSVSPPPGKKVDLRPGYLSRISHEPRYSEEVVVTVRS